MSRAPPLPPGPPPIQAARNYYESYRPAEPQDNYRRNDENYPPHSSGPPPAYQFRGSNDYDSRSYDNRPRSLAYRYAPGTEPSRRNIPTSDSYRPRDDNFNFRYDAPPSIDFGRGGDSYRPRSRSRSPRPDYRTRDNHYDSFRPHEPESKNPRRDRQAKRNQRDLPRGRGGYRGRGGAKPGASDREFLHRTRVKTPDLMPGIEEDQVAGNKFRDIDEMTDSDEAEMDVSDDENDESEGPAKKHSRITTQAADGDSVPRWSNPDPYTALPPPDETQRKKKDVVKLIRKARVDSGLDGTKKTEAITDDFISFDFDDDEPMFRNSGSGVLNAPTGPRQREVPVTGSMNDFRQPAPTQHKLPDRPVVDLTSDQQVPKPIHQLLNRSSQVPDRASSPEISNKSAKTIDLTPDPALGSRKRTIRDEIKGPPQIYGNLRGKKPPSDGKIVSSWKVRPNSTGTPWVSIDHSPSANMGIWMHKEIMDFYHFVKHRDFEQVIREKLVADLRDKVRQQYPNADILPFGSFVAGLYLPTSDMDLVCVSRQFLNNGYPVLANSTSWMHKFGNFLTRANIAIAGTMEVIGKAKVPLVKYIDRVTGLRVDISFENDTGLVANKTFQDWKAEFPAMPILVTLIKHYLAMRGLNEPSNGGIGGFSVICLVVSLLQHMPQVQSRNMIPEHHLGEILMEFFDLYGNQFDFSTTAISMKPAQYISKHHVRNVSYRGDNGKISILDPNRPDNDIAGGSSNTARILQSFRIAYQDLQHRMATVTSKEKRSNESILGAIISGDYSTFRLQREHLAHVHEVLLGPVEEF
ncbi:hypothetical protein BGZ60DRAFT_452915 [Tricladium varicosporioides]|nr:hypothetical protein BGZ60DRAFT_452915 [Hymenoscyphus varicosporioides]